MINIPRELKIIDFKDFCIRRNEVYETFWDSFAPFFDITIYRDYLLDNVLFSKNPAKQEALAGKIWEYLMGDINDDDLVFIWANLRKLS